MNWTLLSDRVLTTRKPRLCYCCGKRYSAGNVMRYVAGVSDGEFSTWYSCIICDRFMGSPVFDWKYHEEGLYIGELWEYPQYKPYRMSYLPLLRTLPASVQES